MRFERRVVAALLAVAVSPGFAGAQELPQETTKVRLMGGIDDFGAPLELDRDTLVELSHQIESLFDRSTDGVEGWGQFKQFPDTSGTGVAAVEGDTLVIHGEVQTDTELALVYERNEGGANAWGLVATLIASDRSGSDFFGRAIAMSGDTIVIGAPRNNSDENVVNTGAAYIFQRDYGGPEAWGEVARLLSSDPAATDEFGGDVAIDGDTVVVLAPKHNGHDGTSNKGALYVFERDHGGPDAWGFVAESIPLPGVKLNESRINLSGDTLVASQFVFERNEGGADIWGMDSELIPSDPQAESFFGSANAILGDIIAIGARRYDLEALERAGAVYLFERGESGEWSELGKIIASDAEAGAEFGYDVALSLTTVAVGAIFDGEADPGAIYIFEFPAPVGGTVQGVTPTRVQCRNLTQAQAFEAPLTEPSWDCEALGLVVASGDRVSMRVVGTATGTEPIGGTVVGQINRRLTCENRDLLQEIKSVMNGATTWNCETEGMDVMAGDTVHQVVLGIKR